MIVVFESWNLASFPDFPAFYLADISVMVSHKLMGIYMGGLILGVILVSAYLTCFVYALKG